MVTNPGDSFAVLGLTLGGVFGAQVGEWTMYAQEGQVYKVTEMKSKPAKKKRRAGSGIPDVGYTDLCDSWVNFHRPS